MQCRAVSCRKAERSSRKAERSSRKAERSSRTQQDTAVAAGAKSE